MKRNHAQINKSFVAAPDGSFVLATKDDSERSREENRQLYQWQAIPHSLRLNGKEVFLIYLERDLTSVEEVLKLQPYVGLLSQKCDYLLIHNGEEIFILRDSGLKPNCLTEYNQRVWYNSYNDYYILSIELVLEIKERSIDALLDLGLGRRMKSQSINKCRGGTRIRIQNFQLLTPQFFTELTSVHNQNQPFIDGIEYFCSFSRVEFLSKSSEILNYFFIIRLILDENEIPREIFIHHFLILLHLWEAVRVSDSEKEPIDSSRYASFTFC